jgi:hypothetical protein
MFYLAQRAMLTKAADNNRPMAPSRLWKVVLFAMSLFGLTFFLLAFAVYAGQVPSASSYKSGMSSLFSIMDFYCKCCATHSSMISRSNRSERTGRGHQGAAESQVQIQIGTGIWAQRRSIYSLPVLHDHVPARAAVRIKRFTAKEFAGSRNCRSDDNRYSWCKATINNTGQFSNQSFDAHSGSIIRGSNWQCRNIPRSSPVAVRMQLLM